MPVIDLLYHITTIGYDLLSREISVGHPASRLR